MSKKKKVIELTRKELLAKLRKAWDLGYRKGRVDFQQARVCQCGCRGSGL